MSKHLVLRVLRYTKFLVQNQLRCSYVWTGCIMFRGTNGACSFKCLVVQSTSCLAFNRGCIVALHITVIIHCSPLTQQQFLLGWCCLVGLVGRCPPWERKIPGSNPACAGFFRGQVIPVTSKLALQWLPCQVPGVVGSALGLVGLVSVYYDWVR